MNISTFSTSSLQSTSMLQVDRRVRPDGRVTAKISSARKRSHAENHELGHERDPKWRKVSRKEDIVLERNLPEEKRLFKEKIGEFYEKYYTEPSFDLKKFIEENDIKPGSEKRYVKRNAEPSKLTLELVFESMDRNSNNHFIPSILQSL